MSDDNKNTPKVKTKKNNKIKRKTVIKKASTNPVRKAKDPLIISNFPDEWKERLALYVGMLDAEGREFSVSKYAKAIGIPVRSTSKYVNAESIKQYRDQVRELALISTESEDEDIIDFLAEVDASRPKPNKNKENKVDIYAETFSKDGELAKDYRKAMNTGLTVSDEIILVRTMIMRATRLLDLQDKRLADFDDFEKNNPEGVNSESPSLNKSGVLGGKNFTSYVKDTNPERGGVKTTYEVKDYNKIIKSLTAQLSNLIELQYKIEYEYSLTASERRDVFRRVLGQVHRGEVTAEQAGNIIVSSGIENIPVPLELKIRQEARDAEPEIDKTPAVNREDILALENLIKTSKQEERIEFLEKRGKEIEGLLEDQKEK